MWLILQHDTPEDFVIATGEMHTVREFATLAFKEVGIELCWKGEGVNEKGVDSKNDKVLVEVDPKYFVLVKWNNYWVIRQKQRLCLVGIQRRPVFLNW